MGTKVQSDQFVSDGWATIGTAYASAADAHTTNSTWEDVNSMSVTVVPTATAELMCTFTCTIKSNSVNWEHNYFKFLLDGTTSSESHRQIIDADAVTSRYWIVTIHTVFSAVSAASHTIKVQWQTQSDLDVIFYERRLTVMICQ